MPIQLRGKQHDEDVAGIFFELRPLVLVPDVIERQWVELEGLFEQGKVIGVRVFDAEPETLFALEQAP